METSIPRPEVLYTYLKSMVFHMEGSNWLMSCSVSLAKQEKLNVALFFCNGEAAFTLKVLVSRDEYFLKAYNINNK
jgi:hypothetical protein